MIVKDSTGREAEIHLYGKYEDDIQIDEAYYTDDNSEVDDSEIDFIFDSYGDKIYEEWYENQCGAAEAWGEGDR